VRSTTPRLERCATVDEVKQEKNKAEALRAYAYQANDAAMQKWVVEIITRAIRRLGEVQNEMRERGELAKHGSPGKGADLPTLASSGVDPHLAAEATRFAYDTYDDLHCSPLVVTAASSSRIPRNASSGIACS
jgi:hypothetical protein